MALLKFSRRSLLMPAAMLVFLAACFLVYIDIKDRTISEYNSEQLILARTASQGISSFFKDYQSDMTFLSELNEIINFDDEGKLRIRDFYSAHQEIISAITRVDPQGRIVYTYPVNESAIGKDISYQKHVSEVIATHKPVISDVFMAIQGYLTIAMHVPIFKDGEYAGSLALLIPIDELGKLYLGKIKVRGTGNVWLLSENGVEIYCPVAGHTGKSFIEVSKRDPSVLNLMQKIKSEPSGTVKVAPPDMPSDESGRKSSRYITFYRTPLGNTYWTILISYQEKDIYMALTRLRNRLIFVFSVFFAIVIYYFYTLAKVRNLLREEAKRIEAEKVLKESEEKFRKIFEDHAAVKLLIDPDSMKIVDANNAAASYYGWDRDQLRSMRVDEINILSPDEIKRDLDTVKNHNKIQFEFRHRLKDGSIRDVEVYTSRIRIGDKDLVHSIVHDITNRKRAEAELIKSKEKAEESDRLKTAFLQNMSHEIRTPMNAIMGFSSLLVENYNNKPVLEQYCGIIDQRCKDLLEIIDDILDVSKIEAGQLSVNPVPCRINDLFSEITEIYREQQKRTGKENIEFRMTNMSAPDDLTIVTDKVKLRQIFINLINNAFKFTEAGKIEGGCKRTGEHTILFFVSDTGIGIPQDKHQVIFERFVQLNQGHGRISTGTGLGLSIVKGILEALGGKIWLESEENKGTIFYFTLPA